MADVQAAPSATVLATAVPDDQSMGTVPPHPKTDEIIRQVEFYFSDENLPHDAHLLAKTGGDGNGLVSIKHIHGFRKMSKYKPYSAVRAALRLSDKVEVVDNKYLRRCVPLTVPLKVVPKLNTEENARREILAAKPWLTKGMLKPTGFEEYATEGPIRPEEYAEERKLYDPEEAFYIRIESAVARYTAKRKMHSLTADIFTQFLMFGGFDTGQRQFSGASKKEDAESMSKDELAQIYSNFTIAEEVSDGSMPLHENGSPTWIVDFATMTRAFFSSRFMARFAWYDAATVETACNVLKNFFNYLVYHDVCPEFEDDILASRLICNVAEKELLQMEVAVRSMPGIFNEACSKLHLESWSDLWHDKPARPEQEWKPDGDEHSLSNREAFATFAATIMAHGTEEQATKLEQLTDQQRTPSTVWSRGIGLEVVRIEHFKGADDTATVFGDERVKKSSIYTTGKLHCRLWEIPHAPPQDLPPAIIAALETEVGDEFVFFMEDEALKHYYPGMKLEADVRKSETGVTWINRIDNLYPSFFTWTGNERIRQYKIPGPPRECVGDGKIGDVAD